MSVVELSQHQEALKKVESEYFWIPSSEPQGKLLTTTAQEVLYGGAAGSGKSDALLGYAILRGRRSLLLRREFTQLRGLQTRLQEILGGRDRYRAGDQTWTLPRGNTLELGSCPNPGDETKYQGQPHSEILLDESAHFTEEQVDFLTGWLRDVDGGTCRLICASNPPLDSAGAWMIERWKDWVDPSSPDPAEPNELRWYKRYRGSWRRVEEGANGAISRTFIPATLQDNPHLRDTDYASRLENLPEQMRDALLRGNFMAAAANRALQVIPNEWIRAAQSRWEEPTGPITQIGIDPSRGGRDRCVIATRHGRTIDRLLVLPREECVSGGSIAARVLQIIGEGPIPRVKVDGIGVGASVVDHLQHYLGGYLVEDVQNASTAPGRPGKFTNRRASDYWNLRTRLDPAAPCLSLPPDMSLYNELGSPDYSVGARGIAIQSKEDIIKKNGRSPDLADAVVLAASCH
ncbi:MAG: terminase [Cyanobacteria bacterium P01_F01_bin.3]